jgi:hypothetical protein
VTGRTVRVVQVDGPRVTDRQSEKDSRPPNSAPRITTARALSSDGPRATGAMRTVCDIQAEGSPNSSRPKGVGQTNRNENAQEHGTNTKNPRPIGSTRTVRAYQADCPPGANRRGCSRPRAKTRAPYHLSFHGSPKRLKLLRKDLGKM